MGSSARPGKGSVAARSPNDSANATADPSATSRLSFTRPSVPRPSLQSRPPVVPSTGDKKGAHTETNSSSPNDNGRGSDPVRRQGRAGGRNDTGMSLEQAHVSPSELETSSREFATTAKLFRSPGRSRMPLSSPENSSILAARRISPVAEQSLESMSPSLNAALEDPLSTGSRTASTESTESTESAKTVRGSVPATPSNQTTRTPSYPFPYVPRMAERAPSFRPFTTLSPTISTATMGGTYTPRGRMNSAVSTPASNTTFMPGVALQPETADPQYPSPSIYDLVLSLHAEPGLSSWWENVAKILQHWYKADRATLAVPADLTDIQNVPWCQKASFNVLGKTRRGSSVFEGGRKRTANWVEKAVPRTPMEDGIEIDATSEKQGRPKLESRHSFAGYAVEREDLAAPLAKTPAGPSRPHGPIRTATHVSTRAESSFRSAQSDALNSPVQSFNQPVSHSNCTEPERSSLAESSDQDPCTSLFKGLRALDDEQDSLIDTGGVLRVVDKGGLVTLTRDYSTTAQRQGSRKDSSTSTNGSVDPTDIGPTLAPSGLKSAPGHGGMTRGLRHAANAAEAGQDPFSLSQRTPSYEEFEQLPSSPWAQSPAPSPAMQADESSNPFFASGNIEEHSFSPSQATEDYSQYGAVEAIGVDNSKTIIHIPLIHPLYSQTTQQLLWETSRTNTPGVAYSKAKQPSKYQTAQHQISLWVEKKYPIAIISLSSSTVPFPHNLTRSLKLLGPHLATSYSNAYQYSNIHSQMMAARRRRNSSAPYAASTSDPALFSGSDGLGMMLNFDNLPNSIAGSMTSPSDCSARSKPSPSGSVIGTPGWEPFSTSFSNKQSMAESANVKIGGEATNSYFDAKERVSAVSRTARRQNSADYRNVLRRIDGSRQEVGGSTPNVRNSQKPRISSRESVLSPRDSDKQVDIVGPRRAHARISQAQSYEYRNHRHSQLHSYGADFKSSFQTLPTSSVLAPGLQHDVQSRTASAAEAQEMLPPSESLLRTIIDALPVQIFTANPDSGVMTWVNSKLMVYRGQDASQILQDPWQAIHPNDREEYQAMWERCLRSGQQIAHKVRLRRFDGNYRWFFVRAAPLKDKRQKIVHWIGTNMDFHDQYVAEINATHQHELAASESKYRALANSSPQIVFAVNRAQGIIFCNTRWLAYSGQTEVEAMGTGFMNRVHPEDLPKCKIPIFDEKGDEAVNVPTTVPPEPRRVFSSGDSTITSSEESDDTSATVVSPSPAMGLSLQMPQRKLSKLAETGILKASKDSEGRPSYSTEVRLLSKDGEYRWHLVRVLMAEPIVHGESDEEIWYGTGTDINDHKLLEQTLKETMDAKSRFLSNMSHEIRTPLNGITGMVNFLIDTNLTQEQMEHVNIIRASTEGLRDLINDILDLSKVEAGMINLVMDWFHVRSIIEEVNDLTSALALEKGIELNYVVEEDVPPMVKGDRFRIRQVLLNIIGNAIKFTQTGEVFVRCYVLHDTEYPLDGKEVLLQFEVIDTGSGFNERDAEYLFKRFSQIDASSTRQQGGTGLGLVISMQLVELHGGKMKASSVPGKGSTFTFFVKLSLPSDDDRPQQPPPTPMLDEVEQLPTTGAATRAIGDLSGGDNIARFALSPGHIQNVVKSPEYYGAMTPEAAGQSPSTESSMSSNPSVRTSRTSAASERSSASSYIPQSGLPTVSDLHICLPSDYTSPLSRPPVADSAHQSTDSNETINPSASSQILPPPMYSILIVCPLLHSREATVKHIGMTLSKSIPSQVTAEESVVECQKLIGGIGGAEPVKFTHIVLVLKQVEEILTVMEQVLSSASYVSTSIVVISDLAQKRALMQRAPQYDFDLLATTRRVCFVFKPIKPSKFAVIFDPQKLREMSTDRNQDSVQQIVVNQKQLFEEVSKRLSNRGKRVLLVEDNLVNQLVVRKFLSRVAIEGETVVDGVQCIEKLFSKPHDYYSIVLCDLHMPNKDGYQTCKEIRRWERSNNTPPMPVLALSANVLGDVYSKCVDAGFNSYLQKPIDFKELSKAMLRFLDPSEEDERKPIEFMKARTTSVRGQT